MILINFNIMITEDSAHIFPHALVIVEVPEVSDSLYKVRVHLCYKKPHPSKIARHSIWVMASADDDNLSLATRIYNEHCNF